MLSNTELYQKMINDPDIKPEVKQWIVDYLDHKHKPQTVKPESCKPPLEYYPDGELKRYLSNGELAPKRNKSESFTEKYKL